MISVLLAILSIGFFIPVLVDYAKTGLVPLFPTLIVCGFVMVAALQSLFSGVILQSLRQKEKHDFEMTLNRVNDEKNNKY